MHHVALAINARRVLLNANLIGPFMVLVLYEPRERMFYQKHVLRTMQARTIYPNHKTFDRQPGSENKLLKLASVLNFNLSTAARSIMPMVLPPFP